MLAAVAQRVAHDLARWGESITPPLGRRAPLTQLVRTIWRDTQRHQVQAFAGYLTYNAFVAMIPFVLFVVLLLRSVQADALLTNAISVVATSLPEASARLLEEQVPSEVTSRIPGGWLLGVCLALGSLWASSAAFRTVTTALDVMYEADSTRSLLGRLAVSVVFALASAAAWLIVFGVIRTLPSAVAPLVGDASGQFDSILRAAIMLLSAFGACAAIYRLVPADRRQFRAVVPGAACAALARIVFSYVFDFVLDEFGRFLVDPLYGWFTGLFALLLYVYWSAYILLLGAEVNHAIEVQGRADRPATSSATNAVGVPQASDA